jgi:2-keto-4-pentenoate hydratase
MPTFEELVAHIEEPGIDGDPSRDIIKLAPDLTQDEALRIQLAVKRRHVAAGDKIIGHQASFTSAGIRAMFPDAPKPMVGTLLESIRVEDGGEVTLDCDEAFIESEMAMILAKDLEGPNLTPAQVLAAVDCFLPSIEVAPLRPGVLEMAYSWPHMIAVQKAVGGFVIFGEQRTPANAVDPCTELCTVFIDGEERATAPGSAAMGNPLIVVAAMAERLAAIGEKLHAGQVIMTGSLPPPQRVSAVNSLATVTFPTLGSVRVRIGG